MSKMKQISEKLTQYVIRSGAVPPESYSVYQYGFQVGLELFCSFVTCFVVALMLNMILEFIIFTAIFMLLRTYAGGVHLEKFISCLICSVCVQTLILIINDLLKVSLSISWVLILICSILVIKNAPVESENKELSLCEKKSLKRITVKVVFGIIFFTIICSLLGIDRIVFLIALVFIAVMISQYIGLIKYHINQEK